MTTIARDGARHLASLRDGRTVYIDGAAVQDVTGHAAFQGAVRSAVEMYDFQARPENRDLMTFASPTTGRLVNRAWHIPRTYADMVERRKALVAWAGLHGGFLGRSPDHVASALAGQMAGLEVFERHDSRYARNLADYYAYCRDNDLFLTYVIINPQGNRAKAAGEQTNDELIMRVVDEDASGITVRGAKMLGTSSIMANEIFVACIQPLRPGEEKLAVSFAIPLATKGLCLMSRKSFEQHAVSAYDNPLATHFDENDALVYFDDVKVPWERVFVNQNTDMCRAQFFDTAGHILQNYQAQIRLMVKLRFLVGIARKITETIGTIGLPPVRDTLGKLASQAAAVEAFVHGMEAKGDMHGDYYMPNRHLLYAAQVYTQELYPQFVNVIQELAGGSLIMLPSSYRDFAHPKAADIIRKTQISENLVPEERVKFLKLAWDALGSDFAGRHAQYEMFYAGAQFVTRGHSFRTYDWDGATGMVNRILSSYSLGDVLEPATARRA